MRDLAAASRYLNHFAFEQPEPGGTTHFGAGFEKKLKPEAYAQDRLPASGGGGKSLVESELKDPFHGFRKGANPGQHHPIGGINSVVVRGDLAGGADPFESLLDRAQVAHPVVEQGDGRSPRGAQLVSVPLVLGTPAPSTGSIAERRARANPLNRASIR